MLSCHWQPVSQCQSNIWWQAFHARKTRGKHIVAFFLPWTFFVSIFCLHFLSLFFVSMYLSRCLFQCEFLIDPLRFSFSLSASLLISQRDSLVTSTKAIILNGETPETQNLVVMLCKFITLPWFEVRFNRQRQNKHPMLMLTVWCIVTQSRTSYEEKLKRKVTQPGLQYRRGCD